MSETDKKLHNLIMNDELGFEANPAIQQRLNYHMQLMATKAPVKQNSLIPLLGGIFTTKFFGLKISMLAVLLFVIIGYNQISRPTLIYSTADTVYVQKNIDTLSYQSTTDSLSNN